MATQSRSLAVPELPPLVVPESRIELVGVIWRLAWPVVVTFALESVVGIVDMVMVGTLGATAVAGVGLGSQILHSVSVVMIAVTTGLEDRRSSGPRLSRRPPGERASSGLR